MPDQITHPSPEELNAFSLGQLPVDAAAAVEHHVSECQPCCETLLGLASDDTFVELIQEAEQLPTDLAADQVGESGNRSSIPEIPAPLAEHPRYEILGLVGKGGMGDVYKATHRMMERTVALKIINRELVCKPEAVDRFHREVKTAARLSHANIVTAHDAEQAGDVHFLVMEYVDGTDLAHTVKQQGALSIVDACDYVRQAATGMQYAHEMGMVHRDIKPHNLMVTADGTVKILDFGLASLAPDALADVDTVEARSDLTAAGSIMGTPDFISPEQADDAHQADIRSDIYSLGTTLYYLLTGRPPFADGSVMHKLRSHAEVEPEPIQNMLTDVPEELAEVLRRMMAKNPAERFQTPAEVADALAPFVDRHRSQSPPPPTPLAASVDSRSRGWKALWAAAVALCVSLAAAGAILYLQTDNGTLVIESDDENVEIAIRPLHHDSDKAAESSASWQLHIGDTVTGSTVKRLRSGEYAIALQGRANEFELSQDRFLLKRGGKVIVRVTRRDAPTEPRDAPDRTATIPSPAFDGAEIQRFSGHTDNVTAVHVLPNAAQAISIAGDRTLRLWDVQAGEQLAVFGPMALAPFGLDVSPDGRYAVTGDYSGKIVLWDLKTRQRRDIGRHDGSVYCVVFTPDGQSLISGGAIGLKSTDTTVRCWDIASGEESARIDMPTRVRAVDVSPDGTQLLVGLLDGKIKLYDWESKALVRDFKGHRQGLRSLVFSPDGRQAASGATDGRVYLWDVAKGRLSATLTGHATTVASLSFTPNGRHLVSGSYDGTIRVWNTVSHDEVLKLEADKHVTHSLAVSPNGQYVLSGGGKYDERGHHDDGDYALRLWRLPDGIAGTASDATPATLTEVRRLRGHQDMVNAVVLFDQHRRAVSGGQSSIRLWDVDGGRTIREFSSETSATVNAMDVSPDGSQLATGHFSGWVHVWDLDSGETIQSRQLFDQAKVIRTVKYTPDGQGLLVVADQHGAWLLEADTLGDLVHIDLPRIRCGALLPDGRHVMLGAYSRWLGMYDLANGQLVQAFPEHAGSVLDIAVSPDGTLAATASPKAGVLLWDVKSARQVGRFLEAARRLETVAFTPDGRHLLARSDDQQLSVIAVESGLEVAVLMTDNQVTRNISISASGEFVLTGGGGYWDNEEAELVSTGDYDLRLWQLPSR